MKQGGRPRRENEKPDGSFGRVLKEYLRHSENFTQTGLARESEIPEKTLSQMIKGRRIKGTKLRRDLRKIIRVLYRRKALLTLEEANRLLTTIPTEGVLDRRDPQDAEILALFDAPWIESEQTGNQNKRDVANQYSYVSSDNRDNPPLLNAFPEATPTQTHPPPVSETTARADREPPHHTPADEMATPGQRSEKRGRRFIPIGILLALLVAGGGITYFGYLAHPSIKPGGGWISPVGKTIKSNVYFAAYAYPTHGGEPAIDHVNFTLYWQGVDPRQWVIACVARQPVKKDIFACTADLHALGTPAGEVTISFDVYDRQGNHRNAPNGTHTVVYLP